MTVKVLVKSSLLIMTLTLVGCETISKNMSSLGGSKVPQSSTQNYRATGYAPISKQPGRTRGEKVINAIRASKLRAYQELAAMVHGQYVTSSSTVQQMVLVNDDFKTAVAGIVRGARVVKSYPIQDDVYATILELNESQLQQAWVINNQ